MLLVVVVVVVVVQERVFLLEWKIELETTSTATQKQVGIANLIKLVQRSLQ